MINPALSKDAQELAILHSQTITGGFLPKLGIGFLTNLYKYLINSEIVLINKENNETEGFISCALDTDGLMKRFIFSSPKGILHIALSILKNPALIVPLFETYKAPSKSSSRDQEELPLPKTELLSISVNHQVQHKSVGSQLLAALEAELRTKGVKKYKVIAGDSLVGANRFYLKNGFRLARQIKIHNEDISNVYVKDLQDK